MGLERAYDREFYLDMAAKHELLADVVAGKTTLYDTLDELLVNLDKKNTLPDFKRYLALAVELDAGLDGEELEKRADCLTWGFFYDYISTSMAAVTGLNLLLLLVPPLDLMEPVFLGAGALLYKMSRPHKKLYDDTKKRMDEIFAPAYEAAAMFDADISRCFVLDHFHASRERFAKTYTSLPEDERKAVDAQLYAFLGAGGIPGTDEHQLKEYLGGLTERGVAPDA